MQIKKIINSNRIILIKNNQFAWLNRSFIWYDLNDLNNLKLNLTNASIYDCIMTTTKNLTHNTLSFKNSKLENIIFLPVLFSEYFTSYIHAIHKYNTLTTEYYVEIFEHKKTHDVIFKSHDMLKKYHENIMKYYSPVIKNYYKSKITKKEDFSNIVQFFK